AYKQTKAERDAFEKELIELRKQLKEN
ncbi:MAG: hypothetical protein ACI9XJ_001547, partial [Marivirga sp.]